MQSPFMSPATGVSQGGLPKYDLLASSVPPEAAHRAGKESGRWRKYIFLLYNRWPDQSLIILSAICPKG
jgi:hypothetical protein